MELGGGQRGHVRTAAQHPVAQVVERTRDAGAYLPGAEHAAVVARRRRHRGERLAGPFAGQGGVEDADGVDAVTPLGVSGVGVDPVQRGVDTEADDAHRAEVVEQHGLGVEPAVGVALVVGQDQQVGDLGGDPGGLLRRQRAPGGQRVLQRRALAPFVHDVRHLVGLGGIEDAQHPRVTDGGGVASRGHQARGALVTGIEDVHGNRAAEHRVLGAPEASLTGLAQQIRQLVSAGEDVA